MGDSLPSAHPPPLSESDLPHTQEAPAGWGGWGNWGTSAFSVISGIQKAAASAADEITKNAIAAAKDAAKGVAELQENVASSLKLQTEEDTEDAPTVDQVANVAEPESPQDKLRSVTLQKLEGAGQDTALGHGLKVIDASVENLASGAWQAFGTAWRGSRTLIQKLENSAENLAESIQKQGSFRYKAGTFAPSLIEGGKAITARGLEVLEYVGKEAIDLIATEAGIQFEEDPKQTDGDVIEDNEHFVDDVTFDRCFYIYGGPEQLEELEALSNHHMLLCNRAKAKLPSEQKSSFDSSLKQLQQVMELGINAIDKRTEVDKGKRVEKGSIVDVSELKQIRETSVTKAAEMATGFTVALSGLAMVEVVQKTTDRLEAIRVEGVHRLSELCASGILQLLNLGKSVLSSSEQDESPENVVWPSDCLEKAQLIRVQAQAMIGDIEAISVSFITGIGDVTAAFQAAIRSEAAKEVDRDDAKHELMRESSIEEKAQALISDLQADGSAAIEKVQSGLRHLVHVVLFTSLRS